MHRGTDAMALEPHELLEELARARARFRKEREREESIYQRDLAGLAAARKEADALGEDAVRERRRLLDLRRRLLVRWKKHWAAQRNRTDAQKTEITADRLALEAERRAIAAERESLLADKGRIHRGWEALSEEEQAWKLNRTMKDAEQAARQRELDEYALRMANEEAAWKKLNEALVTTVERKRVELDGLQRRIDFLRPAAFSDAIRTDDTAVPHDLERQTFQLRIARETWRAEEVETLAELEEIAGTLVDREASLEQREAEVEREASRIEQEREHLKRKRVELEANEARLRQQESTRQLERDSQAFEVEHLKLVLRRRTGGMHKLAASWAARRRMDAKELRSDLGRCRAILALWCSEIGSAEKTKADLRAKAVELAGRAAAVEQARALLLESTPVATAYIERQQRRVEREFARQFREAAADRAVIAFNVAGLEGAGQQIIDGMTALHRERAQARDEWADWELKMAEGRAETDRLREDVEYHKARHAAADRVIHHLRGEIERLGRSMIESGESPRRQAA